MPEFSPAGASALDSASEIEKASVIQIIAICVLSLEQTVSLQRFGYGIGLSTTRTGMPGSDR
jgi:hypothetical protein